MAKGIAARAVWHGLALTLFAAALLHFLPFFLKPADAPPPALAWAPGYWEVSPLLGIIRVVPVSPAMLVNPVAASAPGDILAQNSKEAGASR